MASGGPGGIPQFASLYVGDLHADVTEAMLYEIFNSVGPVASIRVCRDTVTRKSLGYGYVNFHSVADAERALDTLNYSSIKGRACRIMWSQRDPSLRKSGLGNVFVKHLDTNIDNKALYDTFSLFGNILSCKVTSDASGKSRGYGFVHYETEEAAKQAIERVNGMQIGEKTVEVTGFTKRGDRARPSNTTYTNLYVKNFPSEWEDAKIEEVFVAHGTITSKHVAKDKKGRKSAFINYETHEQATKAIEALHQKDFRSDAQKEEDKEAEEEEKDREEKSYLLYCQRAQSKTERLLDLKQKMPPRETPAAPARTAGVNLYIKNLDENADDVSLRGLFEPFGTVTSAAAMKDTAGKCKGFGFICYASPDEATKAVTEMHLKVVKGKPLYVGLAEKKDQRQERLRQRYAPGAGPAMGGMGGMSGMGGMGGMGGKGMMAGGKGDFKGGKGMDFKGGAMGFPQGGMGGMGGMPQMGMGMYGMGGMGGMGGMTGMGGMAAMQKGMGMPPQGMMYPQMMMGGMGKGGPGPQGKGTMPMGGPQMMGMSPMGKGPMMGGKGMGPMPGMMGMGPMGGMMPMGGMGGMMPMGGKGPMPGQMGMMRPGMPGGPGMMPQQQQAMPGPGQALTAAALAAAPPAVQKQMIGERLFPAIAKMQPELAGKITGMMLEMDNSELLILLESEVQLRGKVDEALKVLEVTK